MKKVFIFLFVVFSFMGFCFAQNHVSVDLSDPIYRILDIAQLNGLCKSLPGYKPYTQGQILDCIDEILNSDMKLENTEISILNNYKDKYSKKSEKKNNLLHAQFISENEEGKVKASFKYNLSLGTTASGGLYNIPGYNQWGIDNIFDINFQGDLGSNLSYMFNIFLDLTRMPLKYLGEYEIIKDWHVANPGDVRTVKKFINTSYLPYDYDKPWDGQVYYLSHLDASGLEGWPKTLSITGGVKTEIRASFMDDMFVIGFGRYNREMAGMDIGSSVTFNSRARPFFGIDFVVTPFDFLKLTSISGVLEYPNQDYMNMGAYPVYEGRREYDDANFWQNAFSINMIELDFKYLHFDLGGTCIWPKRFELGYLFPLTCFVEYQNHIGDRDNLSLFGDLKLKYPGLGSAWVSLYIDEINGINNNPFTSSRMMFAFQAGLKYVIPKLSFGTLAFRYSKVEPYCYTHQMIKTPWYDMPLSENYTNNGESLGYYMPPNSDEFLLSFDWMPLDSLVVNTEFQFSRHGADYGSQQVPGSSLYSELTPFDRDSLHKYFLHDGAYNWIYRISFGATFDFQKYKVPVELIGNLGIVYSYWTKIDDSKYTNDGKCTNVNFSTPYYKINTSEYPEVFGAVLTLGVKVHF